MATQSLTMNSTSEQLSDRFRQVRAATMAFVSRLTAEDMMVQSSPEASPVKWHLAHTSWFFETFVLSEFVEGYVAFDPDYRWLFNSYYKAVGDMPEKKLRASFSRPALERVLAFRAHVDAAVEKMLDAGADDEALRRIVLGLQHEQQHLELAVTDIKHAFYTNPLQPAYRELEASSQVPGRGYPPREARWMAFPAGMAEVGVTPHEGAIDEFAFDNETPRHKVYVEAFELATRAVTCAEYLDFMNDNGYGRPELWLSEGWDRAQADAWEAPLYWRRDAEAASGWSIFTLNGWLTMDALAESPVCHVSLFEADAFARWRVCRLPTEFEWEVASQGLSVEGTLLDGEALHPQVAAAGDGLQQMFGDVWEWTGSAYLGYPGYKALPGALGEYNGKFMSSQMVLRGGSCATPASHIRATYRNFFQPGTRWQFSGIRLAR